MNLFFSPSVSSYQALAPHFQACEVVEKLIETHSVQFELNPYDDSSDPYYLIHSRIKLLKHKVFNMLSTIQSKYHEQIIQMDSQQKIETILKMKSYMKENKIDHLKYLDYEQHWLQDKVSKFRQFSENYDTFLRQKQSLQQQLDCLRAKLQLCQDVQLLDKFIVVTGVCQNETKGMLERIIFRQSKGHSISMFKARERNSQTSIFLCLMNKNIYKHIGPKISKACECNKVNIYELPNIVKNLNQYQQTILKKIREADQILQISGRQLTSVLHEHIVGEGVTLRQHLLRVSYLQRLVYIICHSKQIGQPSNHVLFTFHIPTSNPLPHLPVAIFPLTSSKIKHRTIMPRLRCLTEVNLLTELFSIPKHNQIIPSIFMFATVPFLFGMMFSDFGHGLLLLLTCFMLKLSPIFYLMAFMSIYCGIIYNQFFGMKIIRWGNLGVVQPVWAVAENGLNFQNSLKMKMSMVIAFFHMGFGMVLKIANQKKRGQYRKIVSDSIPKILLLFTTVGYLVLLIVKKWLTDYSGQQSTAPSIINSLLQLYLGWNPTRKHSILGSIQTQHFVGSVLNKINVVLLLILVYNNSVRGKFEELFGALVGRRRKRGYRYLESGYGNDGLDVQISEELQQQNKQAYKSLQNIQQQYYHQNHDDHANQLGPLEVFQFVLGLISSTTSYLRLFALSLAHAKLSSLILQLLLSTLSGPHPYVSFVRCIVFFCITIGMMLTLDVMQCLMHVVRLHWVEWMGKFYTGSGKLFVPEVQQDYV